MTLAFWSWLMKQQNREDMVGDLARDADRDTEAPHALASFRRHLLHHRTACRGAHEAMEQAEAEYDAYRWVTKALARKDNSLPPGWDSSSGDSPRAPGQTVIVVGKGAAPTLTRKLARLLSEKTSVIVWLPDNGRPTVPPRRKS